MKVFFFLFITKIVKLMSKNGVIEQELQNLSEMELRDGCVARSGARALGLHLSHLRLGM
jgi:hypothetical protein